MAKTIDGYNGTDFYWSHEYKYFLRDCSITTRRKVRKAWLKTGLDLLGKSDAHLTIVYKYCANDCTIKRKYGNNIKRLENS